MNYPKIPNLKHLSEELELYAQLKSEYGAKGIARLLSNATKSLQAALNELKNSGLDMATIIGEAKDPDPKIQIFVS